MTYNLEEEEEEKVDEDEQEGELEKEVGQEGRRERKGRKRVEEKEGAVLVRGTVWKYVVVTWSLRRDFCHLHDDL